MECKKCNKEKLIVNKFFQLCMECNNLRLHGSKYGKSTKVPHIKRNPLKRAKNIKRGLSEKAKETIRRDEEVYEKVFNESDHKCEECGCQLNEEFRDSEGRVINRSRYSHIYPKSTHPKLRHEPLNFNNLCLLHHEMWENGDKQSMKIFRGNQLRHEKLKTILHFGRSC